MFGELLRLAAGHRLVVQMVLSMEDIRTQHPLVRVPPVDASRLPRVMEKEPAARVMLLNWTASLRGQPVRPLVEHLRVDACFLDCGPDLSGPPSKSFAILLGKLLRSPPCQFRAKLNKSSFLTTKSAVYVPLVPLVPPVFDEK